MLRKCNKIVKDESKAVCCDYCSLRFHVKCVSVSVEYYNQISAYGINGCRSTCVAASGRD